MPTPTDDILYQKAKTKFNEMKHSAYKSGLVVKEYKRLFAIKYGSTKQPYKGDKAKGNLTRWYKQDWKNQRGEVGYQKKGDIYRPTKKYGKTPTTFSELTKKQIENAKKEKALTGRVVKFDK